VKKCSGPWKMSFVEFNSSEEQAGSSGPLRTRRVNLLGTRPFCYTGKNKLMYMEKFIKITVKPEHILYNSVGQPK
jgi:hypothetical protein